MSPIDDMPMISVHTAAQVRALDRVAIEQLGIPSYTLMTRAGEAALNALLAAWPEARRLLVVCGPGNNGGDGYVLARRARERQLEVIVAALSPAERLGGDARRAWADYTAGGGMVQEWHAALLEQADVVVDALFGTGLSRPVDAAGLDCIQVINDSSVPVLALDMPSGLDADTGLVLGGAVRAKRTIAFIGLKLGYYLGEGPDYAGEVLYDPLGVPAAARSQIDAAAKLLDERVIGTLLPPRARTAHKGQYGHVLVIGGGFGMAGAARLAGEAALRTGAGRVTVATRAEHVAAILAGRPELMCRPVERRADLDALIARADVLAVGPGLGQDAWAREMFQAALASRKPAIVDADGLNLLAQSPQARHQWVLTPHPGEAARLLETTIAHVQRDRLAAARAIVARYGGTVVLKGAGTLVAAGDDLPAICDRGNPGMASAGMGDVLTGVIAAVAAQTQNRSADLPSAARAGVLIHALAGDRAAWRGERGLLAADLFAELPACVNQAAPGEPKAPGSTR